MRTTLTTRVAALESAAAQNTSDIAGLTALVGGLTTSVQALVQIQQAQAGQFSTPPFIASTVAQATAPTSAPVVEAAPVSAKVTYRNAAGAVKSCTPAQFDSRQRMAAKHGSTLTVVTSTTVEPKAAPAKASAKAAKKAPKVAPTPRPCAVTGCKNKTIVGTGCRKHRA